LKSGSLCLAVFDFEAHIMLSFFKVPNYRLGCFIFSPFSKYEKCLSYCLMWFWVKTKLPKSWLIITSCWGCAPPKTQHLPLIAESVHCRLMKVVSNDSPTQVLLSTFNTLFCVNSVTNRVINKKRFLWYDVIIASLHRKLHMLYNVDHFLNSLVYL